MNGDALDLLRGQVDLVRLPFTDAESRLLLFRGEDGAFRVALARYEVPDSRTVAVSGLTPTDAAGDPLPHTAVAGADEVACETGRGTVRFWFADPETLAIRAEGGPLGLRFAAEPGWHVDWAANGTEITAETRADGGTAVRCQFGPDGGTLALRVSATAPSGPLPRPSAGPEEARARWAAWFAAAPEVALSLRAKAALAWWVLRANQIRPGADPRWLGVAPSKIGYVAVWNWDSCFHAVALRQLDPGLARDQVRLLLAHQRADGMQPDTIHDGGVLGTMADLPPNELAQYLPADATPEQRAALLRTPITKPPLLAWATAKIDAAAPDDAFLAEAFPALERAHGWWGASTTDPATGLCTYGHPFSSGLDDSPLWDGGPPVVAPELNAYLVLECDALGRIAERLGRPGAAARYRDEAEGITERLMRHLWDPDAGTFWPLRHGQPIRIRTPFSLMPLLTGRLPAAVADRLVADLTDPGRFWSRYPVPTVALDEATFDPGTMWRGPVWGNVNLLLAEGLRRSGRAGEADRLGERTLAMLLAQPDFGEYTNPVTGLPPRRAKPMFSWTASAFLEFARLASQPATGPEVPVLSD